jgi:hypothetical protein
MSAQIKNCIRVVFGRWLKPSRGHQIRLGTQFALKMVIHADMNDQKRVFGQLIDEITLRSYNLAI